MKNEDAATDWLLADFDFELPADHIATQPVQPRDRARLLHVGAEALADCHVSDLPTLLRPDDLLVMNDTKVIPARLYGRRGAMAVELLLHKRLDGSDWLAFARPSKRLRVGEAVVIAPDFSATVIEKRDEGEIAIRFNVAADALWPLLQRHGHMPLPPYIKRPDGDTVADRQDYQTVYAQREGAVAAPTAGLHFTPSLLQRLRDGGIETATVTLHVGAGTFRPVKVDRVKDHVMHAEWGEITPQVAATINAARREGRRIVAVGTTSLRLLETATDTAGATHAFVGDTAIFITPGYRFRAVDALMTNFHLPKSTLFMLVAAFAGLARMRQAYAHAIAQGYHFYSYGDACLLEKADAA